MPHVYVLRCADGSLYVGATDRLQSRIVKHNEGSASTYTARRRPVVLVYVEHVATRNAALRRERQLKGWTRAKKEALIAGDLPLLKMLNHRRRPGAV